MPVRQLDFDFREGLRRLSLSAICPAPSRHLRAEKSIGDAESWRGIDDTACGAEIAVQLPARQASVRDPDAGSRTVGLPGGFAAGNGSYSFCRNAIIGNLV
jgi:hypothetical protein